MGHQVNFHATPEDIGELARSIDKLEPMVLLHSRSPSSQPRNAPSLNLVEDGQPWLFYHLVRERDVSDVVTKQVPAQGYWVIDVVRSPVVELNSCYFDGKMLRRGRVYYVDGFYGADDTWVEKSESFRSWARAVLRTTRKVLKKHGTEYIGKDALAWLERDNGRLVT